MKKIAEKYNVSRETIERFKVYESMLCEWQQKFNLVSNASLKDCQTRHFADSVQLFQYIPPTAKTLLDFGSGAGFPGMVLAILAKDKTPYLKVKLIESIKKKTLYLNAVAQQIGIDVEIINERVENLPLQKADVITARAMTALSDLLDYAFRFTTKRTVCIFPKGKNYAAELKDAKTKWKFDCEIIPSQESDEGVILLITNLLRK